MQLLWQDLRYGARMLKKQPGFTLIAVVTLALGIGATTAIFSVVNAVLLNPLPFPQSERIVRLWEKRQPEDGLRVAVRYPNFQDWRQQNQVFSHMAAYREDGFNLRVNTDTQRLEGARVTVDFFNVLGVQPALGRAFSAQEDAPGGERVVILSHALWQQSFGGDAQLMGRQLNIDGQNHTVIGIMPPGFVFPGYGYANEETHLWFPFALEAPATGRGPHRLRVLGRLQPTATVEQARADLQTIAQRLEQAYPATNKGSGVFMIPLQKFYDEDLQRPLSVLLGAVLFVLLIACANVANLLLARNAVREREIAIRAALGAGRGRLIRQLLTESLLLVTIAGAGGLLLAAWGVELLTKFGPRDIPRLQEAVLNGPVLVFTAVVSVLTGLIFGLAPAWQRAGLNPNAVLKAGARTAIGSGHRLRNGLVIAEVALAMLLLVGAGLMLKSFARLQQVAPGFDAQGGLTMEINLPQQKFAQPEQRAAQLEQVLTRLRAIPGVQFAGATHRLPLRGNSGTSFEIEGHPVAAGQPRARAIYRSISPEYFRAMGTPLLAGRAFTEEEGWRKPTAVIINQTLARRYWPNESPLGKRIKDGAPNSDWAEIVGVAADTKEDELTAEVRDALYLPYVASAAPAMTLVLRTGVEPLSLVTAAREEVRRVDAELAVSGINTLSGLLAEATAQPRFNATLLMLFALLALTLAAVGIYGVIAYAVAQRTQEIGLRMALGAQAYDVLRLILAQGLKLTLCGIGSGLLAAWGLTHWLKALLFGVSATDPLIFVGVALLLAFVALLACWIPARRATKVAPIVALHYE
ncbi:MAG: ABC transporter permease [Acidobacteria bacterium]|nr:ABC transporter permease [Acidobacteriota bacterium]